MTVDMPSLVEQACHVLSPRYLEPHRRYHGLAHVRALLNLLDEHWALVAQPETVALSIWFHDAIYVPERSDNEDRSAALAEQLLDDWGASAACIVAVCRQVRATANHAWTDADADTALFLDMDLSTLGAPPSDYRAYAAAIRAEYDWVPDTIYANARTAVLRRFLMRPTLFFTPAFQLRLEAQARANITDELARLGAGAV